MQNQSDNRNQENRIRRLARQHGYVRRNLIVLGERSASLDDIEFFLSSREAA
jgi:hypothetical protein